MNSLSKHAIFILLIVSASTYLNPVTVYAADVPYVLSYHASINGVPAAIITCNYANDDLVVSDFTSLSRLGTLNKEILVQLVESVSNVPYTMLTNESMYPIVYTSGNIEYLLETRLFYSESGKTSIASYSVYAYYAENRVPTLVILKQWSEKGIVEVRVVLVNSDKPLPGSINLDAATGVRIVGPLASLILIGAFIAIANISKYRVDKPHGPHGYGYTF